MAQPSKTADQTGRKRRNAKNRRSYMRNLRARILAGDPTVSHGRSAAWEAGCRCQACMGWASQPRVTQNG